MTLQAQVNGATATEEFVQYEVADGVCTIWLNRPQVMNCVNWGLLTQLGAALERAEADDAAARRARAAAAEARSAPAQT